MKKIFPIALLSMFFIFVASIAATSADGSVLYASCVPCHGKDGMKKKEFMLKGQKAEQIIEKLQGYADGTYGGAHKSVMQEKVKNLSKEDIKAVAAYIETL